MNKIWTIQDIREEIAKLDKITGLSGRKLPIYFCVDWGVLGSYIYEDKKAFAFSFQHFWNDFKWTMEDAIDVIKHEYAHYMDEVLYNNHGHGETWKKCCLRIGAYPGQYYDPIRRDYYHYRKDQDEKKLSKIKNNKYKISDLLIHPKFGEGRIVSITGKGLEQKIEVLFEKEGLKKLGLVWVSENCEKIHEKTA